MSGEMGCPDFEVLSAYVDRETTAEEAAFLRGHLPGCALCSRQVRTLKASKKAVSAFAVPPMPADLKESLLDMAPEDRGFWGPLLAEIAAGLRHPASLVSLGAAICAALIFWGRGAAIRSGLEIPADLLIGAHNQYALTMPLAPAERILTEMPRQLASGWDPVSGDSPARDGDVY